MIAIGGTTGPLLKKSSTFMVEEIFLPLAVC